MISEGELLWAPRREFADSSKPCGVQEVVA